MIFSELYSAYYNAVAGILRAATDHPLEKEELREIVEEHAFGESILQIEPALAEERWQLLRKDGTTPVKNAPSMPLTTVQKRWLKAISLDPRIRLFTDEIIDFPEVVPLFTPEDYSIFDRYEDGDDYEDETYIRNFRMILDALRGNYPLMIQMESGRGNRIHTMMLPKCLEYSEKDDKFRVICSAKRDWMVVNLARITGCEVYTKNWDESALHDPPERMREMVFDLMDRRNALERVLLHFAHFEKQVERLEENLYRVRLKYSREDETEMVIRLLSFGPMIRVREPARLLSEIKKRLNSQKNCGL